MSFDIDRRTLLGGVAATAVLPGFASAGAYPDRPMHVVIGFPAGSGADILGRYFTHQIEVLSKQAVVVDNKPGANSNIAVRYVAESRPDGYTVLFVADSNMAGSRYLFKHLPFDTIKDFKPISTFAEIAFVLVTSPKSKFNTLGELLAHLKTKKEVTYGYTNQFALLTTALFKELTGLKAHGVAYKTAPDTMRDITDGTLDFVIMDGTFSAGQVRQGTLKPLAVTTTRRSPSFPDVPTMEEAGIKGFGGFAPWWCAYVPKNTPQPVIDTLRGYFEKINTDPATQKFLTSVGSISMNDGPAAADKRLKDELPRWEKLVKAAGIPPQ